MTTGIGKLVMVGIRGASLDDARTRTDINNCASAGIGGVILFADDVPTGEKRNIVDPDQTRLLIEALRNEIGEDLIIAIDQEGGHASRLTPDRGFRASKSAVEFAELSADERHRESVEMAHELAELDIDWNLAPCVDLAIEASSSIIAAQQRSFGATPEVVTECAGDFIRGHNAVGVRTCIKHFPGHGSAQGDTHEGLVDVTKSHSPQELDPYRSLLIRGDETRPTAVMIAHVMHRLIDSEVPASLSSAFVRGSLRRTTGWDGVIVTDSLDMRAVSDRFGAGEAAVRAIEAGCDIALDGANGAGMPRAAPAIEIVRALNAAAAAKRFSDGQIAASIARIAGLRRSPM